jgi:hypothetical protein
MHVRLGFGTDTASFQEGLARLSYKLKGSVNYAQSGAGE